MRTYFNCKCESKLFISTIFIQQMKIEFSVSKHFHVFSLFILLFLFSQLVPPHFNMAVACFIGHLTIFITLIVNYIKREKQLPPSSNIIDNDTIKIILHFNGIRKIKC